jgi:uncharacterized protein YegP (UPF0339 family)
MKQDAHNPQSTTGVPLEAMLWKRTGSTTWRAAYVHYRLVIEKIRKNNWRARIESRNGKPIGVTMNGYATRKQAADRCCDLVGIRRFHTFGMQIEVRP